MTLKLIAPTLDGPKKFTVGGREFAVPATAGVRLAQGGRMAYVIHQGRLHAFTKDGEIGGIPEEIRRACAQVYFGKGRAT
jgi:hypothetical protein